MYDFLQIDATPYASQTCPSCRIFASLRNRNGFNVLPGATILNSHLLAEDERTKLKSTLEQYGKQVALR